MEPTAAISSRHPQLIGHPLAQHKLTFMRDKDCSRTRFRQLSREMGAILAYEALRFRKAVAVAVETERSEPEEAFYGPVILAEKIVLVPILRGGLILGDGGLETIPNARIGHIGLGRNAGDYRKLVPYLVSLPLGENYFFIVMDLVVATGVTACAAIDQLKRAGIEAGQICLASVIVTYEGMTLLEKQHPGTHVVAVAVDELNGAYQAIPGLGDTAYRLFGAAEARYGR